MCDLCAYCSPHDAASLCAQQHIIAEDHEFWVNEGLGMDKADTLGRHLRDISKGTKERPLELTLEHIHKYRILFNRPQDAESQAAAVVA